MDELDHNLLEAWDRVLERCRRDPAEARRRYERMHAGGTYDRPVRAWTVAIRASDTRLNNIGTSPKAADGIGGLAPNEPGIGGLAPRDNHISSLAPPDHRPQTLNEWINSDWVEGDLEDGSLRPPTPSAAFDPIRAQPTHEIIIDGDLMRTLGGPVRIDYPGLPIDQAAALLGKHKEAIRNWLPHHQGRTRAARAEAAKGFGYDDTTLQWQEHEPTDDHPLGVRYVPQRVLGRSYRGGGMETPVVWTDGSLDPGASKGRPPSRWWGSLWQSLADNISAEFEQVVKRVPRFVPYPDKDGQKRDRFRGWWWKCPGVLSKNEPRVSASGHELGNTGSRSRLVEPGVLTGCGRLVRTLYAPLPVWTIGKYLGMTEGLEVEGLSGQWLPGVMDRWAGRRSLACEHCWKLRRTSFAGYQGWNDLVTHLSGGLLFGKEVKRPSSFTFERRHVYQKRKQAANRHEKPPQAFNPDIAVAHAF